MGVECDCNVSSGFGRNCRVLPLLKRIDIAVTSPALYPRVCDTMSKIAQRRLKTPRVRANTKENMALFKYRIRVFAGQVAVTLGRVNTFTITTTFDILKTKCPVVYYSC